MIREVHNDTRLAYNKIADMYYDLFSNELNEKPFDREYLDKYSTYFNQNARIADIGCGPTAHIGRYLHDKGFNISGIDISERCILLASKYNPQMAFICIDMLDWHPTKETFDGIVSYYSIIYTPKHEIDKVFQVFRRTLVKGGKVLIVVKKGKFEGYQEDVLGIKVNCFLAEYQEEELNSIVTRNGFRVDEIVTREPYTNEIAKERIYCLCSKLL